MKWGNYELWIMNYEVGSRERELWIMNYEVGRWGSTGAAEQGEKNWLLITDYWLLITDKISPLPGTLNQ